MKICINFDDHRHVPEMQIKLEQRGIDRFRVTYGKQVGDQLSYGEAAKELGECIMHALACDGHLDNRERGEKS